jgi:16S rRNA (guanine527-N7)-methyltransferase
MFFSKQPSEATMMEETIMRWLSCSNAVLVWLLLCIPLVSPGASVHGFDLNNKPVVRHHHPRVEVRRRPSAQFVLVEKNEPDSPSSSSSSSVLLQLDPNSRYANYLLSDMLGLSATQCDQLRTYCELIVEWNEKINLVSRKDCSVDTVFGRHVLPCLAPVLVFNNNSAQQQQQRQLLLQEGQNVVDVGTGGGFPGIPLAICFPKCRFLLVDSVNKKLVAVQDMVSRLQLDNVKTMHSRAEQIQKDRRQQQFDWCVGRSVASLPTYCHWIQHLLKPSTGKLLYIVGGNVPEAPQAQCDYSIHDLFTATSCDDDGTDWEGSGLISEKRILIFEASAVKRMAKQNP